MTTTTESIITPALAADVANALTDATAMERFVMELPAESVALYLARLWTAATNIRALTKGLEQRLVADEQIGQHWTFDDLEFGFFGSQQKGYDNMPGLFEFLMTCGISAVTLAGAVSDARVTDLREAANRITDDTKRQEALDEIEAHRVPKGARGAPRFQAITEYAKK